MAGTPDMPTIASDPPFGLAGAGDGPGAGTTGGPRQGPLWQPDPQWALVLPQKPYMEQQLPCGQFPQTVPPFAAPQVPFVVTGALGEDVGATVGLPRTGSWDEPRVFATCEVEADAVELLADWQPFWHPLATRQCAGVLPHQPYCEQHGP
jgi:hypothetical protein